jgi:hypothetical protein
MISSKPGSGNVSNPEIIAQMTHFTETVIDTNFLGIWK